MNRRNRTAQFQWKTVLSSPFSIIAAFVIFVFVARAALRMDEKATASSVRLVSAQTSLARLSDSQSELAQKVSDLSTPEGIEADLREKYHAVAPGESVAVILDASSTDGGDISPDDASAISNTAGAANTTGQNQSASSESRWQRFLDMFGI